MSQPSNNITEALDRIRYAVESLHGVIDQPNGQGGQAGKDPIKISTYKELANGDFELVLAFNNDETIKLEGLPDLTKGKLDDLQNLPERHWPYFSSSLPFDRSGN